MLSMGLFGTEPRYIRRARAYLEEARMAMLEHSMAAEHYQASADMYAERARSLEQEIAPGRRKKMVWKSWSLCMRRLQPSMRHRVA